jgi:hypothetical protein
MNAMNFKYVLKLGWEMMNIFEIHSWVPHKPEGKQL